MSLTMHPPPDVYDLTMPNTGQHFIEAAYEKRTKIPQLLSFVTVA
jgi:hypothetical protein